MTASRVARLGGLALALLPLSVQAANGDITLLSLNDTENGQDLSVKVQILVLMTLLGLLPAMLLMMTCFTRFIIVLAILRQAIGLQQSPPNNVLIGIALCLTLLVMRPAWQELYENAYQPFETDQLTLPEALDSAKGVMARFMLAQTNKNSLVTMVELAGETMPEDPTTLDFSLILPAFVLSELKTAFQLGFMIFIPFLVIDLVVASVLMSMGMMMLSPMLISAPFKILLFILVDGWVLVVGTLAASFNAS